MEQRTHQFGPYRVLEIVVKETRLSDPLPMIISFHGRGDRPWPPTSDDEGRAGVRLVYPTAPEPLGDGYTWFPFSVSDRTRSKAKLGAHIVSRSNEFAELLTHKILPLMRTIGKPIVTGFSQGGMMSLALALLHPSLIGGAIPSAPWMHESVVDKALSACGASDFPPIHALHGHADPIVPAKEAQAIFNQLSQSGLDTSFELFDCHEHSMTMEMHQRRYALTSELLAHIKSR